MPNGCLELDCLAEILESSSLHVDLSQHPLKGGEHICSWLMLKPNDKTILFGYSVCSLPKIVHCQNSESLSQWTYYKVVQGPLNYLLQLYTFKNFTKSIKNKIKTFSGLDEMELYCSKTIPQLALKYKASGSVWSSAMACKNPLLFILASLHLLLLICFMLVLTPWQTFLRINIPYKNNPSFC